MRQAKRKKKPSTACIFLLFHFIRTHNTAFSIKSGQSTTTNKKINK